MTAKLYFFYWVPSNGYSKTHLVKHDNKKKTFLITVIVLVKCEDLLQKKCPLLNVHTV